MNRILAALGLSVAIGGTAQAQDGFYGKYETPVYSVERTIEGAEVRTYAPHLVAEVAVRGSQDGARSRGFRTLAGYIFGGNDGGASVSMTSPVAQTSTTIDMTSPVSQTAVQAGGDDVWTVQFSMPRAYTMDTLPAPNNDAVRIVEMPERRMLVLPFSGTMGAARLETQENKVRAIAQNAGLDVTGPAVFMFYDGPMTLPFNRRNEVALPVD